MSEGATFTLRTGATGSGIRVAVKDLIDVEGLPTTGGSKALVGSSPAERDAKCLAGTRAANARIVGLTNLNELAFGVSGINTWTGTPVNPLDARRVPGGSSSGSAVAVATGEADVAFGTDTTGSIRLPAACCGVAGLKTTWGRVSLDGVRSVSPLLDSVGPLGRSVGDVVAGMQLLEPGFELSSQFGRRVARVRLGGNPAIDSAIDAALLNAELDVVDVELPGWNEACAAARTISRFGGWESNRQLYEESPHLLGEEIRTALSVAQSITRAEFDAAVATKNAWTETVRALFTEADYVAMASMTDFPPLLEDAAQLWDTRATAGWSLAGVPALAMPVPQSLPASLQLVAPWHDEESLLTIATHIESVCC